MPGCFVYDPERVRAGISRIGYRLPAKAINYLEEAHIRCTHRQPDEKRFDAIFGPGYFATCFADVMERRFLDASAGQLSIIAEILNSNESRKAILNTANMDFDDDDWCNMLRTVFNLGQGRAELVSVISGIYEPLFDLAVQLSPSSLKSCVDLDNKSLHLVESDSYTRKRSRSESVDHCSRSESVDHLDDYDYTNHNNTFPGQPNLVTPYARSNTLMVSETLASYSGSSLSTSLHNHDRYLDNELSERTSPKRQKLSLQEPTLGSLSLLERISGPQSHNLLPLLLKEVTVPLLSRIGQLQDESHFSGALSSILSSAASGLTTSSSLQHRLSSPEDPSPSTGGSFSHSNGADHRFAEHFEGGSYYGSGSSHSLQARIGGHAIVSHSPPAHSRSHTMSYQGQQARSYHPY